MTKVHKIYKKYLSNKKKNSALDFFKSFMPEMIYRTMKLEGEPSTRRRILSLFT